MLTHLFLPCARGKVEQVDANLSVHQLDGPDPQLDGGAVLQEPHVEVDVSGAQVEIRLVAGPASPVKDDTSVLDDHLNHGEHLVVRGNVVLKTWEVDFSAVILDVEVSRIGTHGKIILFMLLVRQYV